MKLKIKMLDEAARWKGTGFNPKADPADLQKLLKRYPADELYVHFDSGVPDSARGYRKDDGGFADSLKAQGIEVFSVSPGYDRLGRDGNVPQKSFNPQTPFSTPVGIYVYPLDWAMSLGFNDPSNVDDYGVFPFAKDKDFIYIYHVPKSSTMTVENIANSRLLEKTFKELDKSHTTEQIRILFSQSECTTTLDMTTVRVYKLLQAGYDDFFEAVKGELGSGKGTPSAAIGKFWFYLTRNIVGGKISSWTRLLLKHGIKFLRDDGTSTIHPSEPHQGVIMDLGAAKLVYQRDNPNKSGLHTQDQAKKEKNKLIAGAIKSNDSKFLDSLINSSNLGMLANALLFNPNLSSEQIFTIYRKNEEAISITVGEKLISHKNFDVSYFLPDLKFYTENAKILRSLDAFNSADTDTVVRVNKMRFLSKVLVLSKDVPSGLIEKVVAANPDNRYLWKLLAKSPNATPTCFQEIIDKCYFATGEPGELALFMTDMLKDKRVPRTVANFIKLANFMDRTGSQHAPTIFKEFFEGSNFSEEEKKEMSSSPRIKDGSLDISIIPGFDKLAEQIFRFNKRLKVFRS